MCLNPKKFFNHFFRYKDIRNKPRLAPYPLSYLLFSMNLCNIAAISALVALSFGFSVLSVLPFIRPLPHAYCIAPIAYSEILSKSLYESMFVYSWAVGDATPYIVNARLACSNFITIKFIACSAAFPLPKKFRVYPSFFGNPIFFAHVTFVIHTTYQK